MVPLLLTSNGRERLLWRINLPYVDETSDALVDFDKIEMNPFGVELIFVYAIHAIFLCRLVALAGFTRRWTATVIPEPDGRW